MSLSKNGRELKKITRRINMKNKLSYLLFAVFLIIVITVMACSDGESKSSIEISPAEEVKEVVDEKVEPIIEAVEEKVEEVEAVEEPTEEPIEEIKEVIEEVSPVEVPVEGPIETLETLPVLEEVVD
jgi:phosphoglycolate phosphatase-like HAD superfamily hydrolase